MKNILSRKIIDEGFEIGVLVKLFIGFFEVLTGTILAISGRLIINNLIIAITQQEISEDPKDFIANSLIKLSNNLSSGIHIFAIVYLIFHGVVNMFMGFFLLRGKIWAYPTSIGLFSIFLIYQIYRCFYDHSLLLMSLTVFDIIVVSFIFLEYKKILRNKK
jgi:uncharacterized membrane protein